MPARMAETTGAGTSARASRSAARCRRVVELFDCVGRTRRNRFGDEGPCGGGQLSQMHECGGPRSLGPRLRRGAAACGRTVNLESNSEGSVQRAAYLHRHALQWENVLDRCGRDLWHQAFAGLGRPPQRRAPVAEMLWWIRAAAGPPCVRGPGALPRRRALPRT